jgi:hypothetical protein
LGHEGGRYDPADLACFRQIARGPGPTGACFRDKDQMLGLGWQFADEVINGTLAGADAPEIGDLGAVFLSDVGHRDGLLMDF